MKVGYISVHRDGTGYSHAAIDYILALDSVGVDVVPRALKLNDFRGPIPKRIEELEAKSAVGVDTIIQHVLPHQMDFNGRVRNIGLYATETDNFAASSWPRRLNMMDELWVINQQMVEAARASTVTAPISVVPHACDTSKFEQNYEPLDIPELKDTFVFYFIGEPNRRKNIVALIKAFHLEFGRQEPVSLMIKATAAGDPAQWAQKLNADFEEIKRGMKLYADVKHYKKEIVVTEYLSEEYLMRLHQTGDCFVAPSRGEAFCLPALDALGMGRPVICSNIGGLTEIVSEHNGWLIDGHMDPCFGMVETFHDLYSSRENWFEIDINGLRRAMRQAYEDKPEYSHKAHNALMAPYNNSYEKIGQQMKELLEK